MKKTQSLLCVIVILPLFATADDASETTVITNEPSTNLLIFNNHDPYEKYNRFMYKVNDKVDRFALKPVAKGYRAVTPGPLRKSVRNFFNNFRDVYSIASNLLRADFKKAANDTMRVAINTTWGIGGLFDIASEAEMPNNKSTFGDTLYSWGWKKSNYFVYPILGPSTVREAVGGTIAFAIPSPDTIVFHGKYDRFGVAAVSGVDTREQLLDLTDSLEMAALDPYAYTRDVFMSMKQKNENSVEDDGGIDDLVAPETDTTEQNSVASPKATPSPLSDTEIESDMEDTTIVESDDSLSEVKQLLKKREKENNLSLTETIDTDTMEKL